MKTLDNETMRQKISQVKLLVLDVDGVLTDGRLILTNHEDEAKNFNVKDGLGLVLLQKAGIKVGVITAKTSKIVDKRLCALGIEDIYQGQRNKFAAFEQLKQKYALKSDEIAYMGDDLPDLPLLKEAGFSAAPKDACQFVIEQVDYVSDFKGGKGAVREIADLILASQGVLNKVISDYIACGEAKF